METRIFDRNDVTGITRLWHYDPETDEATIETQQDVSNVVEENKDQFNATDNKANWTGEWHKVASIPLNIYYELQASGKITDQSYMKRFHKLNGFTECYHIGAKKLLLTELES